MGEPSPRTSTPSEPGNSASGCSTGASTSPAAEASPRRPTTATRSAEPCGSSNPWQENCETAPLRVSCRCGRDDRDRFAAAFLPPIEDRAGKDVTKLGRPAAVNFIHVTVSETTKDKLDLQTTLS